jgi:hypothetical protein
MTTNTLTHEDRQDQVTRDGHDTARRPTEQVTDDSERCSIISACSPR